MCSRAHHRCLMMRNISSSLNNSAALRLSRWKQWLASSWLIHWYHATTRINRASSTPLGVITIIWWCSWVLGVSRRTSLKVGLSCIATLILNAHLRSLSSYGMPYHRLTVLLIRILSILLRISWGASLIRHLSLILSVLLLLRLMKSIDLTKLTLIIGVTSMWLSLAKIISSLLPVPPLPGLSQLLN